jgi:hypothetical protein
MLLFVFNVQGADHWQVAKKMQYYSHSISRKDAIFSTSLFFDLQLPQSTTY